MARKQKPRKPIKAPWAAAALVLGLVALGALAARLMTPMLVRMSVLPNNNRVDFHTYFSLDRETPVMVSAGARVIGGESPLLEDEVVYLPISLVREYMDAFLFWDAGEETLYVTTRTDMLRFTPGGASFLANGVTYPLETGVIRRDGVVYMPAPLLMRLYPYAIAHKPAYNIVTVDPLASRPGLGALARRSPVRYRPDNAADVAEHGAKDDVLVLFAEEGAFTRTRTADGLLGYVLTADITPYSEAENAAYYEAREAGRPLLTAHIDNALPLIPNWPAGLKVNMVWEDIGHPDGNAARMEQPLGEGINVLSPTWFTIDGETLDLVSIASEAYVAWAHNQGVRVWPRVIDQSGDISHAVLTNGVARNRLATQLSELAALLKLDGINMDFESVRAEDGDYYIQFLRELAILIRGQGMVLSVDVYVPMAWSAFYRRDAIALTADFVCVMAYDEHYKGSENAGPVASLPFVRQGVADMLLEVPKAQLVMGLPFFNRVWRIIAGNDTPQTRDTLHYGMEFTKGLLIENGITPEWDPVLGYFYGEYGKVESGEAIRYCIWLEDENSIAEKLKIYAANDLAGTAGWRRGFENNMVWQLLREASGLE